MDLDRLRGFLAFAREMNFSSAARRINVSQPALHGQVKRLEEDLGVSLYTRDAGRTSSAASPSTTARMSSG